MLLLLSFASSSHLDTYNTYKGCLVCLGGRGIEELIDACGSISQISALQLSRWVVGKASDTIDMQTYRQTDRQAGGG